jgi:hypothetical protein
MKLAIVTTDCDVVAETWFQIALGAGHDNKESGVRSQESELVTGCLQTCQQLVPQNWYGRCGVSAFIHP